MNMNECNAGPSPPSPEINGIRRRYYNTVLSLWSNALYRVVRSPL